MTGRKKTKEDRTRWQSLFSHSFFLSLSFSGWMDIYIYKYTASLVYSLFIFIFLTMCVCVFRELSSP